jgi:hypothetical protein
MKLEEFSDVALYQGMASAVPIKPIKDAGFSPCRALSGAQLRRCFVSGHGFSHAAKAH